MAADQSCRQTTLRFQSCASTIRLTVWRPVPKFVVVCDVSSVKDHRKVLGISIRNYRTDAGFTLESLAEKAELHPNFLGRVERGEEYISIAALRRIARALKVRVRDLVDAL